MIVSSSSLMKDKTHHTMKNFSNHKESLQNLTKTDVVFLEICEDYDVCVQAIHYWQNQASPSAAERTREFQTIANELANEINNRLLALNK